MRALLCMAILLVLAAHAHAQRGITATVRSTDVVENQPFLVTITARGGEVGDPILPVSPDVGFTPSPSVNSTSIGRRVEQGVTIVETMRRLGYNAWAKREGTVVIPPVTIYIDGQEFQSEPITLQVAPARETQPGLPQGRGHAQPQRPGPAPPTRTDNTLPTLDDIVIFETSTDKSRVYPGEPIVLTLRIMVLSTPGVNINVTRRPSVSLPTTDGFYAGPMVQEMLSDIRNGWRYEVTEVRQPLFPTGTGEYMIGPASWRGTIRALTQQGMRYEPTLRTDPIRIEVMPLPERPAGFSGAVGHFNVHPGLQQHQVPQGVPTRFTLRIEGRGNPNGILAPRFPSLPWANVSEPEVETNHDGQDWTRVQKTFSYNIVPLEVGEFETPELEFVYFDPQAERYHTVPIDPMPIHVQPSAEGSQLVALGGTQRPGHQQVTILGEDLLPLLASPRRLHRAQSNGIGTAAGVLAPPLLFLLFLGVMQRRKRLLTDSAYARNLFARSKAHKRLKHLEEAAEPAEALYRTLTAFLADKLDVNETGMTSEDARALLETRRADPRQAEALIQVLRNCERRRYASGTLRVEEVHALREAALTAVDALDASLNLATVAGNESAQKERTA